MRTPPRGRNQRNATYSPPVARNESIEASEPGGGRRRVFDIVILLVIALLAAVYISVWTNRLTPAKPATNMGLWYNGQLFTYKPNKVKSNKQPTQNANATPLPAGSLPVISEIMAGNRGSIAAVDGKYYDWIELYNPTGRTLNLAGFALSNNPKKPQKFILPNYNLEADQCVLVFASGKPSTETEIDANFKLSLSGQTLILSDPNGKLVQSVTYPPMRPGYSYAMDMNDPGKWSMTDRYTPGFPNTDDGYAAYQQFRHATSPIYINEVMANNKATIKDEDGDYSDWVELYNPTDQAVDITGWGLSNRESEPKHWVFPQMKIEAKQYLVVFLSHKDRSVSGNELHTNFRLNSFKDTLLLSNFLGQIVSEVQISNMKPDESLGRVPGSDQWQTFAHPTPGFENTDAGYGKFQGQ